MRYSLSALVIFIISASLSAQDSYRANPLIDVVHYDFNINVNDTNNIITGSAVITLKYNGLVESAELDLKNINSAGRGMVVGSVTYRGGNIRWDHRNDKLNITIDSPGEAGSMGEFLITYSGIPADGLIISKNKFGNRAFFADHWPDRARNYLPCVDHPSDKATVDFIITAPGHYEVVANGYLVEESDLPGGDKLTHWREDVPLPVKVMTFGAASFAVRFAGNVEGIPVWTWVYPENRKEGFYDYSFALKPLAFFSKLIGPYPYEKLANVQSKTIFGGLENAGCIFYSENSVTGEGKAEGLLAHEIAHQWFGNSVTEADWHHIWLSEGFATYLTSVYMEKTYGKEKLDAGMNSARDRVLRSFEKTPGPVIDTAITDLMKLLSANSYQKGAWVLHMLRQETGDENFWKGIRLFYERFRNGNALTADFEKVMEEVSGKNLKLFFHQWLYIAGQPDLKINVNPGRKKGFIDVIIEQKQHTAFIFNIEFSVKDSGGTRIEKVAVTDKITRVSIKGEPDSEIIPDPNIRLLFRTIQK
ncbi:MAG: metallopeptidase [Odoribacter sp.]|nr:metallopeptidase [Odoribacter sp.]